MNLKRVKESNYTRMDGNSILVLIPFSYYSHKGAWGGGTKHEKSELSLRELISAMVSSDKTDFKEIIEDIIQEREGHRRKRGTGGRFPTTTIKNIGLDNNEWDEFKRLLDLVAG